MESQGTKDPWLDFWQKKLQPQWLILQSMHDEDWKDDHKKQ